MEDQRYVSRRQRPSRTTGMDKTFVSERRLLLTAAAVLATGCGDSVIGPQDLAVEFEVSRAAVPSGGQLTATVRLHNPSSTEVTARAFGCPFQPHVSIQGEARTWVGTSLTCVDGPWTYRIAAGATDEFHYELTAADIRLSGLEPAVPAAPGEYELAMWSTMGIRSPEPIGLQVTESN